ncbi:MAG: hypothetical protein Q7R39_11490 [Dehalococcoidia bacterium]|nr:hypothetical protein [Dehalococcoidia bacterium]
MADFGKKLRSLFTESFPDFDRKEIDELIKASSAGGTPAVLGMIMIGGIVNRISQYFDAQEIKLEMQTVVLAKALYESLPEDDKRRWTTSINQSINFAMGNLNAFQPEDEGEEEEKGLPEKTEGVTNG